MEKELGQAKSSLKRSTGRNVKKGSVLKKIKQDEQYNPIQSQQSVSSLWNQARKTSSSKQTVVDDIVEVVSSDSEDGSNPSKSLLSKSKQLNNNINHEAVFDVNSETNTHTFLPLDLSVHAKKIEEVKKWFESVANGLNVRSSLFFTIFYLPSERNTRLEWARRFGEIQHRS